MQIIYRVFSAHVQPTVTNLTLADKSTVVATVNMLNVQLVCPGQGTVALVLPPTAENWDLFAPGADIALDFTPHVAEA